ncbi:MAG TPA: ATP-binding protein [Thermoanaerobaculia bacterium]|nr:ATP-binding protein [Thermoanaerobaculia bacterium]
MTFARFARAPRRLVTAPVAAILFALFGIVWIFATDAIAARLPASVQTVKGIIFTAGSAIALYFFARRQEKSTEEQLEQVHQLIDQVPTIIWQSDRQLRLLSGCGGGITSAASTVLELFGEAGVAAHERALAGEVVTFQARIHERDYTCCISPERDKHGHIVGVVGSAVDRTEDRHAEEALASSEAWFRSLIEGSYDLVAALDPEGRFIYSSIAAHDVLGYDPDELRGTHVAELIHPDDRFLFTERMQQTLATHESVEAAIRFTHRTKEERHLDVRFRFGRTPQSTETIVLNFHDITERLLLEREFESAERLASLGRVASSIAHEFNNVLMGIQPHAELVLRKAPAAEAHAKSILSSVDRGRRVTQDVLRFTRAKTPQLVPVDAASLLEQVRNDVSAAFPPTVLIDVECQPKLMLHADREQLAQAITNLLTNARDAMPGGGRITIRASRDVPPHAAIRDRERFAHISVEDTGLGISDEVKARMFEPLYTTKRGSGGTGLGLNVVHQIARAHGGSVFVESEIGHGATFHLIVPASAELAPETPAQTSNATLKELMIVEDDPIVAAALIELATTLGLRVVHFPTAATAIERFDEKKPEVALLDIGLPDLDGTQLALMLWRLQPELPVVFMTGHSDKELLPTNVASRAEVLRKPFDATTLMNALTRAVSA